MSIGMRYVSGRPGSDRVVKSVVAQKKKKKVLDGELTELFECVGVLCR